MTMTNPIPEIRPSWEGVAAKAAAVLLVGSSAGVGGLYAWTTGIRHGVALGALAVAMALALEIAKPLAVAAMIEAGWRRFGRALAMTALALAAVAYSLTSGLSLIGAARGDGLAQRAAGAERAADAKARRDRLASELAAIPKARTPAEIEPLIAATLARNKGAAESGCEGWQATVADRAACIDVQKLKAEAARATQRERLAADLAAAEAAVATGGPAVVADPGALAIATYARQLGLSLDVATVGQWLALVPVLALEIGSALSVLLAKSFAGGGAGRVSRPEAVVPSEQPSASMVVADDAEFAAVAAMACAPRAPLDPSERVPREDGRSPEAPSAPEARLLGLLRSEAGRWAGSRRRLADRLDVTRGAADALLARLSARGQIAVRSRPRQGTVVRLVGSC